MEYRIREERAGELEAVCELVRVAFADVAESDHLEQHLVRRLHQSDAFVPQLLLVAETADGEIAGYILFTEASIIPDRPLAAGSRPVVTLAVAPLVVHPAHQRRGVGGLLLREAHRIAADLGYGTAVLLGHKDYYPRFGYRRADACGITFPFEAPAECCMVKELLPGALPTARGHVQYPPAFQL